MLSKQSGQQSIHIPVYRKKAVWQGVSFTPNLISGFSLTIENGQTNGCFANDEKYAYDNNWREYWDTRLVGFINAA